jgi:hypothetical protein
VTYKETIKELESLKNQRGIKYYQKTYGDGIDYLGLGLTPLRKLARKIKINHDLADELSLSKYFEARILSIMVDDPKLYTQKKLEKYIKLLPERFNENPLSYFTMMFTEYIVSKSPDAEKVISKLAQSKNGAERFIAYSSLANLGRINTSTDEFFIQFVSQITSNIQAEENNVKDAMNNSLLYWGQRNKKLNKLILNAYDKIGSIAVDYGDTSCKTPDVPKTLRSERIQEKINNA